ncbi:Mbov_0398 family ICE element protein [Metamycoplasma equirhinis]|uniref:Mbov_0398 family ICE element protein n=1 Tax=Metamycoplasma equirhinis TaxID=92402 RepID=UPI00359382DA
MENKKQDKKLKDVRVTFRFYELDDIVRFEKLKKEANANGDSISIVVANIVRNYLLEREKKIVMKNIRDDIYYALRKVLFASLAPFSANIIREILKNRIEDTLINKKIDVLLNKEAHNIKLDQNQLNNLTTKILAEPLYFEQMRELFNAENKTRVEKINKKIAAVKEQQKKFEEYDAHNADLDSEIIAQTYDDYDYDLDINDLTLNGGNE